MLINLKKRTTTKNEFSDKTKFTNIDFILKNGLIYNIKKKIERLCVFSFCEKEIFRLIHDFNNHADRHKTYQKLMNTIFIFKLTKKTREYVKHCSICELNQIKRHTTYGELIFITTSTILFRTIAMDFIVKLSKKIDFVLTIICKTFKKNNVDFRKNHLKCDEINERSVKQIVDIRLKIARKHYFE